METLCVKDAATWTGTSEEIIRRLIRDGRLPARPRGQGPRSGYLIAVGDLERITRLRKRKLGSQRPEVEHVEFIESAPLFPGLPTPKLPPVRGSVRELIAYAGQCQRLAEIALSAARRRMEEGDRW